MKSALILIDIQNDYFTGGKSELYLPERAAQYAAKVLQSFRSRRLPVYYIQHIGRPGGAFFLPGSHGAEINAGLAPIEGEKVFVKHFPNMFLQTELRDELARREIRSLVVCGMMSHMCVDTSVRAAQDYGFSVTVLEDACTTKDLIWHHAVLPAETVHRVIMASLDGTFASVVKTDDFLLKECGA